MDDVTRRDAVERAYRDHADDVYRVAYAVIRDREAAGDVTQDAFARAFERWHTYDPARPLLPWLQTIGANLARDAVRRRRIRTLALPEIVAHGESGPAAASAVDPADAAARRDLVDGALDGLEPRARAALVLRHYHGYDYAAIATILGTAPGTVGSLLSRAHATLRTRLDEAAEQAAPGLPQAVRGTPDREVSR